MKKLLAIFLSAICTLANAAVTITIPSGDTYSFSAGSTLTINGALSGTPTGGTLNLSNVTLSLGTPTSGNLANCTFPTLNQNTTGSAATLTTPRAINGVNFNGSAAITVPAAAGTLIGTALNSTVVTSSLTSVGALTNITPLGDFTITLNGAIAIKFKDTGAAANSLTVGYTQVGINFDATTGGGGFALTVQGNIPGQPLLRLNPVANSDLVLSVGGGGTISFDSTGIVGGRWSMLQNGEFGYGITTPASNVRISVQGLTGTGNDIQRWTQYTGTGTAGSTLAKVAGDGSITSIKALVSDTVIGIGTPTASAGAGAGTGGSVSLDANANDISGTLTVVAGTVPSVGAVIATVTFGTAKSTAPHVVMWPANAATSVLSLLPYTVGTTTTFTINAGAAVGLTGSTTYAWNYIVTQ